MRGARRVERGGEGRIGEYGVLRGAGVRPGSLPRPGSRGFVPRWAHFHGAFHCIFRCASATSVRAHLPELYCCSRSPGAASAAARPARLDASETSGIRRPPRRWPARSAAPRGCIRPGGPGATRPRAAHARHSRGKAADGARFQRRSFLNRDTPTAPRAARGRRSSEWRPQPRGARSTRSLRLPYFRSLTDRSRPPVRIEY